MPDGSDTHSGLAGLPEDEVFLGLFADHFASHHLFVAEGEGALAIDRLFRDEPGLTGPKTILYADTAAAAHRHLDRLRALEHVHLQAFPTMLDVLRCLQNFDTEAMGQLRIYAAGSLAMLRLVGEVAESLGLARDRVMCELVEPDRVSVACLPCGASTSSRGPVHLTCSGCGAPMTVSDYYCFATGTYMGLPQRDTG